MIELRLLGLHAIRGADGREIAALPAQPKRFALLAYLAIGGEGYHRRDTLAAMFWPELDQFAARRALRNTLYHLREALGDGVILTRGDEAVSIDPATLACDVTRLRGAVRQARYEEVVDLYGGELLAGVHFASAGEAFEEWLSRERRQVTDQVLQAIRALVEREERAGTVAGAAYWAQRACTLAPEDESWLRRAMSLLEQASDTGGALHLYGTYAQHLLSKFGAQPSAGTQALAARIRAGTGTPNPLPDPAPSPAAGEARAAARTVAGDGSEPPAPASLTAFVAAAPAVAAIAAAPASPEVVMPRTGTLRSRRAALVLAVLGVAALLALLVVRTAGARHTRAGAAQARVIVTVFDNRTGDAALQAIGRMTQDWLVQGIVRAGLAHVVDPRAAVLRGRDSASPRDPLALARRTGATLAVYGSYYRLGDTLYAQAAVSDVHSGRILRVVGPILSSVHTPLAALDDLRSRVMSALASAVDVRGTQGLGGSEPPPFDAYRDYVDASDAFWHGDAQRAKALYLRAARRDTTFVAAALGAAVVAANSNDCALVDSLSRALEARAQPMDRVDRLTLQIASARCGGRNEEMLRLALERADLEPGNSSAQISAAHAALWANRPRAALEVLARVDPSVDLAWSTDTTHFAYWGSVTAALHVLGRYREELAAADHMPPGSPLGRVWLRGNALAALSRPSALLALLDSALALPVETAPDVGLAPFTDGRPEYTVTPAYVANWLSRELAFHGDTVAARQAAMRAVAWYRSRPAEERATIEERLVAAWSLEMAGALPEAERIARQLVAEDSSNVDFRGELAGLAAERGDTALADSLDLWLARQPAARVGWSASMYRARVAALLGHPDQAIARIRETIDEGAWPAWFHQEPEFAPLRSRPDFRALTAPRD